MLTSSAVIPELVCAETFHPGALFLFPKIKVGQINLPEEVWIQSQLFIPVVSSSPC